jgi:hypothetical protein
MEHKERKLFKTILSENDNHVDSIEIEEPGIPDDHVITGIEAVIKWGLNIERNLDGMKITADVLEVKIETTSGIMREWGSDPSYDDETLTKMDFIASEIKVQFMGDFADNIVIQPNLVRVEDGGCMVFF